MMLESLIKRLSAGKQTESAAPPQLVHPVRVPYGHFRFKTQLGKGQHYQVHASTDLRTWTPLGSDTAGAEPFEYIDAEAFKFSYRFYRLRAGAGPLSNVLGFATQTLPPGFSMIANPFDTRESIAELLKGWPDGTTLNKFDTRLFKLGENAVQAGRWSNPSERLLPGEGAIFYNPTSDYKVLSFVGNVLQGSQSTPIPGGFSIRSSLRPQPGNLDELGFPIANGDVIHLFDREGQKYVLYPFEEGKWSSGIPVVSVGESFWVAKTEAGNWRQTVEADEAEAG